MNKDLEIIKKYYGEKMMHLCRSLFPTILETEGLLSRLLLENFAPSKSLYYDIMKYHQEENFKNYIYSNLDFEQNKVITNKTPKELLTDVGYDLYECKTEQDIQYFKKYFVEGEELCTFNGDRLKRCHVFFAVKKNIDEIKRENFKTPERQDEYGTSVISIQFTRGEVSTLSIKNRYNHKVNNPDATFSNNLENIIPGLTDSFEKEYGLNINQDTSDMKLGHYVKANDGRYYKYNYEINNIYYCPDNIIIDNFEVIKDYEEKEKYVVIDYFILDLVNKTIKTYGGRVTDCFVDGIKNIEKINIIKNKESGNRIIEITTSLSNKIVIEIDYANRIVGYKNNELLEIGDYFLWANIGLKYLELKSAKKIGGLFNGRNFYLEKIEIPNVIEIGNRFMCSNLALKKLVVNKVKKIGDYCLTDNRHLLETFIAPEVEEIGTFFLLNNKYLEKFEAPKLKKVGESFLASNLDLIYIDLPSLEIVDDDFLVRNKNVKGINLPKVDEKQLRKIINQFNIENIEVSINGELYGKNVKKVTKLKQSLTRLLNKINKLSFVRESNLEETKENSNVRN